MIISIVVHVVKHQSVLICRRQGSLRMMLGSPSIYSQLNSSCYSYTVFFRLHIYVISKWLLTQLTHALTAIAGVSPYVHSTCTSYVLNAYLYCIYALVGGAISIRDPYICAISRVCAKESHAVFHRPVVCAVKT